MVNFTLRHAHLHIRNLLLMLIPIFTTRSRLIMIAPHPDDEALACSVILQHAVRAGTVIRVVYATDGDDNPWP